MSSSELRSVIEAILFISGEPVRVEDLVEAFSDEGKEAVEAQLGEIARRFQENEGGFYLEQTAGGYRLATRPEFDPFLRKYFSKQGEGRLSMAALETMSIIAYRQPVTAPEISEIRGVNSSGVIRTLLERKMIRIAGRKNVVGSPFLYRTTKEFLVHFGLNSLQDLPRLEEFAELLGESVTDEELVGIDTSGAESVAVDVSETESSSGESESSSDDVAIEPSDVEALDGEETRAEEVSADDHADHDDDNSRDNLPSGSDDEAEASGAEDAEVPDANDGEVTTD